MESGIAVVALARIMTNINIENAAPFPAGIGSRPALTHRSFTSPNRTFAEPVNSSCPQRRERRKAKVLFKINRAAFGSAFALRQADSFAAFCSPLPKVARVTGDSCEFLACIVIPQALIQQFPNRGLLRRSLIALLRAFLGAALFSVSAGVVHNLRQLYHN